MCSFSKKRTHGISKHAAGKANGKKKANQLLTGFLLNAVIDSIAW